VAAGVRRTSFDWAQGRLPIKGGEVFVAASEAALHEPHPSIRAPLRSALLRMLA